MSKKNKQKRKTQWLIHRRQTSRNSHANPIIQTSTYLDYVITNKEEMDILSQYILDYPNIETGGQLFGYWTFDGKPVVLFVLGPGPKAGHYVSFFMQDIDYLKECASILKRNYGLDHVGEWHSHHQLGLSHPSGHDARNISKNMRKLSYKKFLLCIATCSSVESSINAFMFDSNKTDYEQIPWVVKDIDSPYRRIIDSKPFALPNTKKPNMVNLFVKNGTVKKSPINYKDSYWLKLKGNPMILKSIIDTLRVTYPLNDFVPTLDEANEVHIEVRQNGFLLEDIHFTSDFPLGPPSINYPSDSASFTYPKWAYNGDILISFLTYYKSYKELQL